MHELTTEINEVYVGTLLLGPFLDKYFVKLFIFFRVYNGILLKLLELSSCEPGERFKK